MIQDVRRSPPFIHFGFFRTEASIKFGESIDVWLHTLYNKRGYSITLFTEQPTLKISDQQYTITPDGTGTFEIRLNVTSSDPGKRITLESNIINLTVL